MINPYLKITKESIRLDESHIAIPEQSPKYPSKGLLAQIKENPIKFSNLSFDTRSLQEVLGSSLQYPLTPEESFDLQKLADVNNFVKRYPIPAELKEKYKPNEIGSALFESFKSGEISYSEYLKELNASLND